MALRQTDAGTDWPFLSMHRPETSGPQRPPTGETSGTSAARPRSQAACLRLQVLVPSCRALAVRATCPEQSLPENPRPWRAGVGATCLLEPRLPGSVSPPLNHFCGFFLDPPVFLFPGSCVKCGHEVNPLGRGISLTNAPPEPGSQRRAPAPSPQNLVTSLQRLRPAPWGLPEQRPAPHLPFDAETPGVIDDPLAHPCNGLGGSVGGVAEDGQRWRVDGGFANTVESCGQHRRGWLGSC